MSERLIVLYLIAFAFMVFAGFLIYDGIKAKHEEQIALETGVETEAFVIDKKKISQSFGQISYFVQLYALKNEYEILVSKELYDQVEQGDYLASKVYKDRIVLLNVEAVERGKEL
ncbi:hypothetical protein D5F11_008985 [Siminovitchia terrae]|uniref:Uncharacterized protein n=1 Tax=Siminovitchia terrae TaxID=1914933 RepID=A0A429XA11_SIMTE|nr:hypothetical protein [Siminovitchia terrae]RST60181.1 hypothetical protein D5F11_008985 [Siminovitchia terrae]